VLLAGWSSDDGEDSVDVGVEEALAEDALAYHAGCSEEDYVHGFMLQRGGCRERSIPLKLNATVPSDDL
jgi:hypothetical protein